MQEIDGRLFPLNIFRKVFRSSSKGIIFGHE